MGTCIPSWTQSAGASQTWILAAQLPVRHHGIQHWADYYGVRQLPSDSPAGVLASLTVESIIQGRLGWLRLKDLCLAYGTAPVSQARRPSLMAEDGRSAAMVMEVPLTIYAILSLLSLSAPDDKVQRELTILLLGEALIPSKAHLQAVTLGLVTSHPASDPRQVARICAGLHARMGSMASLSDGLCCFRRRQGSCPLALLVGAGVPAASPKDQPDSDGA